MRTVIETPTFQRLAANLWSDDERLAFIDWIATNPTAGDVITGAQGARKVRWSQSGGGKSGGVRIIYFNITKAGVVLLVTLYAKKVKTNITANEIHEVLNHE